MNTLSYIFSLQQTFYTLSQPLQNHLTWDNSDQRKCIKFIHKNKWHSMKMLSSIFSVCNKNIIHIRFDMKQKQAQKNVYYRVKTHSLTVKMNIVCSRWHWQAPSSSTHSRVNPSGTEWKVQISWHEDSTASCVQIWGPHGIHKKLVGSECCASCLGSVESRAW